MRLLGTVVGLALVGCTASVAVEAAPPSSVGVSSSGNDNPRPMAALRRAPVSVAWSDVHSSGSCFFFSGPGDLGRDDHLGASASLTLEPPNAELVFEGDLRFVGPVWGGTLAASRESPHEYGGTWTTRETLRLSASGDAWVGTYHYDELDPSTRAPSSCHIDAAVVVVPRR